MGVIAVADIDYGQIFGPFPSYLKATDPAYVIGLLTSDKHPDGVVLKIDTNDWRERMGAVEWLPYVSSARDEEEQNMEAYPKEGCIFYRTLRIVRAGEELLVWYSKDFTQILAVPELNTNSKRDDEQFICTHCGEMFEFPFPLRAHLKFKCAFASEENIYCQRSNFPQLSPGSFRVDHRLQYPTKNNNTDRQNDTAYNGLQKNNQVIGYSENNNRKSPISSNNSNSYSHFLSNHRKRHSDNDDADGDNSSNNNIYPPPPKVKSPNLEKTATKRDSLISHSIENLSKSHVKTTTTTTTTITKEEEEEDEEEIPKQNLHLQSERNQNDHKPYTHLNNNNNNNNNNNSNNNNLLVVQQSENVSAFRKVERSPHHNNNNQIFTDSRASPVSSISSLNSSSSPPPLPKSVTPPKIIRQSVTPPPPAHRLSVLASHTNSRIFGQSNGKMINPSHKVSPHISLEPSTSSFMHPSKHPIKHLIPTTSNGDKSHISHMTSPSLMGMYMPRLPLLPPQPSPLRLPPTAVSGLLGHATSGSISTSVGGSLRTGSSGLPMPVHIPVHHAAFPAADQIPPGLLEMCRATIPTVGPLTESFAANIRNGNIQATLSKQALFADRHISTLGFLKSTNPMVEKLLQTTNPTLLSSPINAMNLSQNWCAKCNATFRMTSDLVYHMRSHHKREFDPMKKKREEKLRCTICNETFRERHHLTRHMSSHA